MRLLLVDDDADTRELLSMYLERQGCEVDAAQSLAEAKEMLAAAQPAVLLTDLNLPDGCGRGLLANGRPAFLKLAIVVSGADADAARDESAEAGFDAHLVKPIDHAVLEELLRTVEGEG